MSVTDSGQMLIEIGNPACVALRFPAMREITIRLLSAGITALALAGSASGYLSAQAVPEGRTVPKDAPQFDHTTVYVRDVGKSVEFYEKVVGLEKIPDPFKDATHAWFRAGTHEQLHIVGGARQPANHEIEVHFAFRVASLDDFRGKLDRMGVSYRDLNGGGKMSVRKDGVHQIYFQDPDGYWIEVNDDRF
jgi:lactoylglutathione lyase